jgi:hypothetical protein
MEFLAGGPATRIPAPRWTWAAAPWAIGGVAAFWTVQRCGAL